MNLEAESRRKREVVVLGLAGACGDEMLVSKEAEVDKVSPVAVELSFQGPDIGVVFKNFFKRREVGEFVSGALAGAMTKAVLARDY